MLYLNAFIFSRAILSRRRGGGGCHPQEKVSSLAGVLSLARGAVLSRVGVPSLAGGGSIPEVVLSIIGSDIMPPLFEENDLTDRCKNSTFQQLRLRAVTIEAF